MTTGREMDRSYLVEGQGCPVNKRVQLREGALIAEVRGRSWNPN